jgi:hypothetical protein
VSHIIHITKTMITNGQLEYDNTINYKGTRHDKRLGCKLNLTSQSTVVSELIPKTYFMYYLIPGSLIGMCESIPRCSILIVWAVRNAVENIY